MTFLLPSLLLLLLLLLLNLIRVEYGAEERAGERDEERENIPTALEDLTETRMDTGKAATEDYNSSSPFLI
jgi:hypothetical protein